MASKREARKRATGGNKVRYWRLWYGMTITELAEHTGVSRGYLGHIEHGEATPTVYIAIDLARTFDVPVHLLFPRKGRRIKPWAIAKQN